MYFWFTLYFQVDGAGILRALQSLNITLKVLEKTKIGLTVNNFRKKSDSNPELVSLSKQLIKNWKKLLAGKSLSSIVRWCTKAQNILSYLSDSVGLSKFDSHRMSYIIAIWSICNRVGFWTAFYWVLTTFWLITTSIVSFKTHFSLKSQSLNFSCLTFVKMDAAQEAVPLYRCFIWTTFANFLSFCYEIQVQRSSKPVIEYKLYGLNHLRTDLLQWWTQTLHGTYACMCVNYLLPVVSVNVFSWQWARFRWY